MPTFVYDPGTVGWTKATFFPPNVIFSFSSHYFHYEEPGIPSTVIFSSLVIGTALISFLGIFFHCLYF